MAIIKNGRINLWNAVKKQFEVVHPETEVERITDFADGIVLKLALTSAMTAVTALQTDSWFGKLLKMVLKASGVRYNIANNGYICFGSFFGGLIIQWGTSPWITSYTAKAIFPISFSNTNYSIVATGRIEDDSKAFIRGILYNHKETSGCILRVQKKKDMLPSTLLSEHEQWVNALASDADVGHDFTLPLSCSVYAYSVCHKGTSPGAVGIESGKAYDVGWTNTPVWIIAIGSM